jgi:hypothetical protein
LVFHGTYNNHTRSGIFNYLNGALTEVALSGETLAPPDDSEFREFSNPTLDPAGNIFFRGGHGFGDHPDHGIFKASNGVISSVLLKGDEAPRTGGQDFGGFTTPAVNATGGLITIGGYGTSGIGIFIHSGDGTTRAAALRHEQIPDLPQYAEFNDFPGPPVMNDDGEVAFNAFRAICTDVGGTLHTIAYVEGPAPGTDTTFSVLRHVVMNGEGQVAFQAQAGGNRDGIWATDADGVLQLVAIEGQTWDVDGLPGGSSRIINGVFLPGLPEGQNAQNGVFNDRGELVFSLSFDGDFRGFQGAYVAIIPEPAAGAACLLGFTVLLRRAGRN